VLVTGTYAGDLRMADGTQLATNVSTNNAFLIKLDPGGALLWMRDIDDSVQAIGRAIAVDSDGEVILAGYHVGAAYLDGVSPSQDAGPEGQMFVAKYGPENEYRWGQSFASDADLQGTAVAVDASDNIVVAGHSTGTEALLDSDPLPLADTRDAFVLKLGPAGNRLWATLVDARGAGAEDSARSVRVSAEGAVLLAGNSLSMVDDGTGTGMMVPDHDLFVATLDGGSGQPAWMEVHEGEGDQIAGGLEVAPDGRVVIAGGFEGELDLGSGPLRKYGPLDIFVAKRPPAR
jgi:hypothetical protein